jgi:uncharacterized membrane protein YdcZ (DUF606 family)
MDGEAMQVIPDVIGTITLVFCAYVVGTSIVLAIYYARREHKYLRHIALMATSYSILVGLVAGSVNFRIFYEGQSRVVASLVALVACFLGLVGLILISRRRKTNVVHRSFTPNSSNRDRQSQ